MTEDELLKRLQGVYSDALTQAIRNQKDFLKKVQDVQSGKIKPPQYYVDRDEVDKWKHGFIDELARRGKIVDGIMKSINEAGQEASRMISGEMVDVFADARDEQIASLVKESSVMFGFEPSFAVYNKKQIEILMKDEGQSPFSKIAYKNLGKNQDVRRRLQHELSVSIINGESQEKMIKRIKGVAESSYKKARTIAQTERTRVQAQGAHEAATEAHAMGIRTYKKWYCANMPTSRDNHIKLHGACALTNELFKYSADGKEVEYPLMYPGDSAAPADQVVNCHCTYVEHVLLDDEDVVEGKLIHIDPELGAQLAEQHPWDVEEKFAMPDESEYETREDYIRAVAERILAQGEISENDLASGAISDKIRDIISKLKKPETAEPPVWANEMMDFITQKGNDPFTMDEIINCGRFVSDEIARRIDDQLSASEIELEMLNIKRREADSNLKKLEKKYTADVTGLDIYQRNEVQGEMYRKKIADKAYQENKRILGDTDLRVMMLKREIAEKKREIVWGTIHEVNPSTPITDKNWKKYCDNSRMGQGVKSFISALSLYPKSFVDRAMRNGRKWHVDYDSSGRSKGGDQYIKINGETKTTIHELAHCFESIKQVLDAQKEFFEYRTANDTVEKLKDLFPSAPYKENEVTKKDNFLHPYMGKLYLDSSGDYEGFELLSMGTECLYDNPTEFKQKDSEMFNWIIGVLTALVR